MKEISTLLQKIVNPQKFYSSTELQIPPNIKFAMTLNSYTSFPLFQKKPNSLNIGCGLYHKNFYYSCTYNTDIVQRKFWKNHLYFNILDYRPFKQGQFDYIWFSHVLEHLPASETQNIVNYLSFIGKQAVINVPRYPNSTIYSDHETIFIKKNGKIFFFENPLQNTTPLHTGYKDDKVHKTFGLGSFLMKLIRS